MIDFIKESDSALFAYHWESKKPKDATNAIGKAVVGNAKNRSQGAAKKALAGGKVIGKALKISPVDIALGGIGLVEIFMD